MKDELTLVVLAAGLGSRFGSLKQIESVGPSNEFIIDYSIYDAIKAGFNKIVFVIKKENHNIFKNTIGSRIPKNIKVCYAFQDINDLPIDVKINREKPLGTAHAIWCCKKFINSNFAIINADDFYGYGSYELLKDFLTNNKYFDTFCMIGYKIANTLASSGAVKRGIGYLKNDLLDTLIESKVSNTDGKIVATPLNNSPSFELNEDDICSMNMFGFTPKIFTLIEKYFNDFYNENKENLDTCEYLMPDVVEKGIKDNLCVVKVLKTPCKWFGVTYKEDKELVVNEINKLVEDGVYHKSLWN